jgi:hypothetical protein
VDLKPLIDGVLFSFQTCGNGREGLGRRLIVLGLLSFIIGDSMIGQLRLAPHGEATCLDHVWEQTSCVMKEIYLVH